MLGNLFLSHPSFFGSYCVLSGVLPTTSQFISRILYSHLGSLGRFFATQTFCHPPRIFSHPGEAGYENKGRAIRLVDLADLLPENIKAQDSKPQMYLDGKLLVSTKKRVQETTDIVAWVEAFTMYVWIFCFTHSTRWQDMTQYKLLILQTAHQFSGKAWFHYDTAFPLQVCVTGRV